MHVKIKLHCIIPMLHQRNPLPVTNISFIESSLDVILLEGKIKFDEELNTLQNFFPNV